MQSATEAGGPPGVQALTRKIDAKLMPSAPTEREEKKAKPRICGALRGVSDRIRTGDRLDHNQELYQLSYAHQAERKSSPLGR